MKQDYEALEMEVIVFDEEDVIVTSTPDPNEAPGTGENEMYGN